MDTANAKKFILFVGDQFVAGLKSPTIWSLAGGNWFLALELLPMVDMSDAVFWAMMENVSTLS